MHKLPGFLNLQWIDQLQLSNNALPITTWLNFDKPSAAFIFIALSLSLAKTKQQWKDAFIGYITWIPAIFIIMVIALVSGYIHFDLTLPIWTPAWLFFNLLLVCVAEEVLFRGLLQRHILEPLVGKFTAFILASLLFGLMHYKGGIFYMGFATLAGFLYGAAYLSKGRIESAILLHFTLNMLHFIFFTYPTAS